MNDEALRLSECLAAPPPRTLAELAAVKRAAEAQCPSPLPSPPRVVSSPIPAWSHPVKEDKVKAPPVAHVAAPPPTQPPQDPLPNPPPILPRPVIIPRDKKPRVASALPVDPEADLAVKLNPKRKALAPARRRDMPCWLSSLMLHMLAVIVLGSIIAPPSKRNVMQMMLMIVGEADAAPVVADFVVLQSTAQTDTSGEQGDHRQPERGADPITAQNPFQTPDHELALMQIEPPVVLNNTTHRGAAPSEVGPRPIVQTPKEGAVVGRISNVPTPQPPSLADGRERVTDEMERMRDDIVDRFTQFDIGKLPGPEGERARREFDALGPDAIPALVRGLNRAARISSSCPVLVISHKLENALSHSRDPSSLRYAVDNLGRDVPLSATHAGVIRALRERLGLSTQLAVIEKLEARGLKPSAQLNRRIDTLAVATPEVLARSLQSPDRETRLVAAMIAAEKFTGRPDAVKARLAMPLIKLLKDPLVRGDAHRALMTLFREPEDLANEQVEFDFARDVPDVRRYEVEATALLMESHKLDVFVGPKKTPSFADYQKIVEKFLAATTKP